MMAAPLALNFRSQTWGRLRVLVRRVPSRRGRRTDADELRLGMSDGKVSFDTPFLLDHAVPSAGSYLDRNPKPDLRPLPRLPATAMLGFELSTRSQDRPAT